MAHLHLVVNGLKIDLKYPVVDITDCTKEEKDQIPLGLAYKFNTTYIGRWVENRLIVFSEEDELYFAIYRSFFEKEFYPNGESSLVCYRMLDEKFAEKLRKELEAGESSDELKALIYACDIYAKYKTVDLVPLRELITDLREEAKKWYLELKIKLKEEEIKRKEEEIKKLKEELERSKKELEQLKGGIIHDGN